MFLLCVGHVAVQCTVSFLSVLDTVYFLSFGGSLFESIFKVLYVVLFHQVTLQPWFVEVEAVVCHGLTQYLYHVHTVSSQSGSCITFLCVTLNNCSPDDST